ncbi:DUF4436 domain-containing protein [Mycobacterium paraterrae]|uniref:DUF4436 domain-containing protein n=1 Tax=Mycobacterium paraterrae TaxID=577492 RepID=A0ABY3VUQ8_9MYCO|nr:DUF4436 domain-containing protein [Mycobacterium paraterrae]UMB70937.1 DUF4436 domain-containing protein [Mycobacterium paraterrae]
MEIKRAWGKTQTIFSVIVATVIGIALYGVFIRAAWHGEEAQPLRVVERLPDAASTEVTLEVEDVESNYSVLQTNLTVLPGAQLLDPVTRSLKEDLTVAVTSVAKPTTITWSKGTFPGVVPVPLTLAGNVELWPFDRYRSGPVSVEVYTGPDHQPFRAAVTFFDQMPGWKVESVRSKRGDLLPTYRIKLHRSAGATAYDIVVLAVLVAIACVAATVSILTIRGRRKFQPPMTTWYAAMLFSVVPLRNSFPGAPPFGSNIDLVLVLWVIVLLVASMLGYIYCWWRDLRPAPTGA